MKKIREQKENQRKLSQLLSTELVTTPNHDIYIFDEEPLAERDVNDGEAAAQSFKNAPQRRSSSSKKTQPIKIKYLYKTKEPSFILFTAQTFNHKKTLKSTLGHSHTVPIPYQLATYSILAS